MVINHKIILDAMAMKLSTKYLSRISKEEFVTFLKDKSEYEISFLEKTCSYCVGIVDVVNSTSITARLSNAKMCEYYCIFLNSMSMIARAHNAVVVKNLGDSLLYYFPGTEDAVDAQSFADVLECSLAMTELRGVINQVLHEHGLPSLDFRVSVDYGPISIASTPISPTQDIFGPTVNLCSKMNGAADPNSVIIGGDMQLIVKSFQHYDFEEVGICKLGMKLNYPAYLVHRK